VASKRDRVQLTHFQLDNYGPWTTSPAPRRETELQALQARIYASVSDFVGGYDGYVFFDRFDNMVAVTDGIDDDAHATFQDRIRTQFPITVSAGIGTGETPASALERATETLQTAGSAQDDSRTEVLARNGTETTSGELAVVHFDVVDATGTYTDQVSAGDATVVIKRVAVELASTLRAEHGGVAHFVGGDNIIAVCPPIADEDVEAVRRTIYETTGVELQAGIGTGQTAHEAGYRAKLALEECRETGDRIRRTPQTPPLDHG